MDGQKFFNSVQDKQQNEVPAKGEARQGRQETPVVTESQEIPQKNIFISDVERENENV